MLLVRGVVRPGSHEAFLETSAHYNDVRQAAGLPAYRRLADTDAGEDDCLVFMCEFASVAEMERADQLLETDPALKDAISAMYEHLVPNSVTATTLRDVD